MTISRNRVVVLIALIAFSPLAGAAAERVPAVTPPATPCVVPATPRAAILTDDLPGLDAVLAREVSAEVASAGYSVARIGAAEICSSKELTADRFDLLVVTSGRSLPADSMRPIEAFLEAGGDLLILGLPAWQSPLARSRAGWVSQADHDRALAARRAERILESFEGADLSKWTRATNAPRSEAARTLEAGEHGQAMHVVIDDLTGWDTLASPAHAEPFAKPFVESHSLTCFLAKGGPRTRQLAVEWIEEDGSRWIATVDLATSWKPFALAPEAFRPWQPPPGRGGKGDRLRVEKAVLFTVGLAHTHTPLPSGRHEYWIDELGTARSAFGDADFPSPDAVPRIEAISPGYLFFPVSAAAQLSTPEGLALATPIAPPLDVPRQMQVPEPLQALHPRPRCVGFDQRRPWRWQPLLVARSADGDHRGAVAALVVHASGPFRGSIVAAFSPASTSFYLQGEVRKLVREVASAVRRGVFLREGGTEHFTAFEKQTMRVGARAVNLGREVAARLTLRASVPDPRPDAPPVFRREWPLELAPGEERTFEAEIREADWPARGPEAGWEASVEIAGVEPGHTIDRLSHSVHVWRPSEKPAFVEARDGGFWLGGKPWKAHGVNYMPSSGVGLADNDAFEHWLGRGHYDPEVIERDLRRIRAMGMNAVSIFVYHRSIESQNLLDFLRRCRELGIRVNQSLRPGTPMDFRWNEMRALIERYRLAQNDTVFAYDLAWEPSHFDHRHQRSYAPAWAEWVAKRHGSVEKAEKSWAFPAPLEGGTVGGKLDVPPGRQLVEDGPWRQLVRDYRAFLDDLLREKYAGARRLVRSIDPNHPVSFRMQFAGDPTHNSESLMPYDFYGLADAVDIWEPEAYGRIGDWEKVKPGGFTAAYARLCDPRKPVLWAEMGSSVWDKRTMASSPERLELAARYYTDFFRMLRESGADGVFFWWYPGGFRVNEGSDYGVINPDGTDRRITEVIRAEGSRFLDAPKPQPPSAWLEVDRDADARGLFGMYKAAQLDYWKALEEGKAPGLRWKRPPGAR